MGKNIDQGQLQALITYDPLTGIIRRRGTGKAASLNPSSDGYLKMRVGGEHVRQHRLAFLYMTGELPEMIDHINGDRADNRWINLRACDKSGNACNSNIAHRNKYGVRGIYYNKETGKYQGRVTHKGSAYHAGSFERLEDATEGVNSLRKKLHGGYCYR